LAVAKAFAASGRRSAVDFSLPLPTGSENTSGVMAAVSLRFGSPLHGWLDVELSGDGGTVARSVSDVPGDSLAMLADAACDIVSGCPARDVTWFLEPDEDRWSFRSVDGGVAVLVSSDRGVETCFGNEKPVALCWTIWRALRRLQADEAWQGATEHVWSRPFPQRSVDHLRQRLVLLTDLPPDP